MLSMITDVHQATNVRLYASDAWDQFIDLSPKFHKATIDILREIET